MIAGSNPNLDRSNVVYGTEYRVEWLRPAYMQDGVKRPVWKTDGSWDGKLRFGQQVSLGVDGVEGGKDIKGSYHSDSPLVFVRANTIMWLCHMAYYTLAYNQYSCAHGSRLHHSRRSRQLSTRLPRRFSLRRFFDDDHFSS